jgi:hypothetical protein
MINPYSYLGMSLSASEAAEVYMFEAIIAILAGVVLLLGVIQRDGVDNRMASILLPVQSIIGLVALLVGILNFFNVIGIALIVAGMILAAGALSGIPGIGDELKRAGNAMKGIGGLVGALLLVLAVYRLL